MGQTKERKSGIELLRILTMFMVLILHYCDKSNFASEVLFYSKISEIAWIFKAFSILAVNCFVLISGYFLVKSNCKYKKILNIWCQVIFYSITIFLIAKVFFNIELSSSDIFAYFLPITLKTYWFISIYIVLYLLAPYLNICLNKLDNKMFKRLLFILLFISWTSAILGGFGFSVIDSSNGYGVFWFITLYCIGAYIRLFGKKARKPISCLAKYIGISIVIYFSRIILLELCEQGVLDSEINCNIFYKYNSITVTFSSIYLFLFFLNIKVNNSFMEKTILKIAPLTLAVYIIHETPLIRNILYQNILKTDTILGAKQFLAALPISCVLVFIACCVIEVIRVNLFKLVIYAKNKVKLKLEKEL